MNWTNQHQTAIVLFAGFFILYSLEFVIPLVPRKNRHLKANISLAVILMVLNVLFTSFTIFTGSWVQKHHIGILNHITLNKTFSVILGFLFLDFWSGYLVHYMFHRSAWLWGLHSVHHSDDMVDVTTTFRQHPIETVIRILFNLAAVVIMGIPMWVLLVYLTISTIHAQLEHANVRLPAKLDRVLQFIIVTPNMHKIHHSKYQHETDSNYSNMLSVWDRMFGTFKRKKDYSQIDYGLDYLDSNKKLSLLDLIRLPFKRRV
jgi:sterol desaturase/sphingolipid hydroxylase (fatty acid hydroxylase superfamily)